MEGLADFSIIIGGPAGSGVFSLGEMAGKLFSRRGYYVSIYKEYPSLIRGGHNFMHLRISEKESYLPVSASADYLIALDRLSAGLHEARIRIFRKSWGGMVEDGLFDSLPQLSHGILLFGRLMAELGMPGDEAFSIIEERFGRKKELMKANEEAFRRGYGSRAPGAGLKKAGKKLLVTGNQAIFLGAVKAGCRHYFAYPMTPASALLHLYQLDDSLIAKQAEDEIAAINMAIGASFAGRRAMVGTSGGGFSLMVEALGLAGMAEIPLVIVEGQRSGPSTGMPTYSEQSDLLFTIHASQGEFPRAVISPGTVSEAYEMIQKAFNLADLIQSPVIFLTEKNLMEGYGILEMKDVPARTRKLWNGNQPFRRYSLEEKASPASLPGQRGGEYVATSYEHDETGFTTEDPEMREKQMKKRMGKLSLINPWAPEVSGSSGVLIIGFGFTKSIALEAMKLHEFSYMHLPMLWPFPSRSFISAVRNHEKVLVIENNHTCQLARLIREQTGLSFPCYGFADGRLLYPDEMAKIVAEFEAHNRVSRRGVFHG